LTKIFTPIGFDVREAGNGQQAVEIWETWQPHLIWMDMRMPVMDGYEATRQIKATTRGQATIIVALTASGLEEEKSVILSEGCDDYMRKPFLEQDLFAMLAKHLGVHYVYQDLAGESPASSWSAEPFLASQAARELVGRLKIMPAEWLAALERAATLGDEQAILNLANQAAPTEPWLGSEIAHLGSKFDHESILALLQEAHKLDEQDSNG
jgi:CheY-like chemotaxis protein